MTIPCTLSYVKSPREGRNLLRPQGLRPTFGLRERGELWYVVATYDFILLKPVGRLDGA